MNWNEMSLEERWGKVLAEIEHLGKTSTLNNWSGLYNHLSIGAGIDPREMRSFMNIMVRQGQIIEQPDGSWITCRDVERESILSEGLNRLVPVMESATEATKAVVEAFKKLSSALPVWRLRTPCEPPEWETRFDAMSFGDIIRTRREDLGYSVKVVADYCQFSADRLRGMEQNVRNRNTGWQEFIELRSILRLSNSTDSLHKKEREIDWDEQPADIPDIPPLDHETADDSEWPAWEERFDGMDFGDICRERADSIYDGISCDSDRRELSAECGVPFSRLKEFSHTGPARATFDEIQKIAQGLQLSHLKLTDKAGLLAV